MLCKNESATYALLGLFPFSLFSFAFGFEYTQDGNIPPACPSLIFP